MNLTSYLDNWSALFEQGGYTLWGILFASITLWLLIVERYWFYWRQLPALKNRLHTELQSYGSSQSHALFIRRVEGVVGMLRAEAGRNLLTLQALTGVLPLLGLLGTVSGMIKVFEVITVFGTGNTRGMASGISEALVTTMAGLFTALSGIYFVSDLENRAENVSRKFEAELMEDA